MMGAASPTARTAIVTGGTRGIGLGIATALAAEGWQLVVSGVRPAADVAAALDELAGLGAAVHYCASDIAVADDRARLVAESVERFGGIDALVNNAGRAPTVRADILDAGEESFETLVRTNLQGPYFLTQQVARHMLERGRGAGIVFVTSVSAELASINRGDYCISKAGVAMATQLWAARLAEFGIDVYEVRPGVIATDMTGPVKEKYDKLIAEGLTVEKRWGYPDDIGKAVAMLARGELPYATGQVLNVDGGITLQRL